MLVTHHPLFALAVGDEVTRAIGRQELALDAVEKAGVDMLLAGHNHHASSHSASDLVTRAGGALVVQAGTATSTRVREQEQSFNAIDVGEAAVTITVNGWNGSTSLRRMRSVMHGRKGAGASLRSTGRALILSLRFPRPRRRPCPCRQSSSLTNLLNAPLTRIWARAAM